MFEKNNAEAARRVRAAIEPALAPGEELLGAIQATRKSSFSGKVFAVGATPERLILVELDRKMEPKSAAISVRHADITKSSIDGWGGGVSHFLASSVAPEIRFDTANEKYKLLVVGGMTGDALLGNDYMAGLDAVCTFIAGPPS